MWVNFAKTGDPSLPKVEWKKFDSENRYTMVVKKEEFEILSDTLREHRLMLEPIIPYLINPGYGNLSLNLPFLERLKAFNDALLGSIIFKVKE